MSCRTLPDAAVLFNAAYYKLSWFHSILPAAVAPTSSDVLPPQFVTISAKIRDNDTFFAVQRQLADFTGNIAHFDRCEPEHALVVLPEDLDEKLGARICTLVNDVTQQTQCIDEIKQLVSGWDVNDSAEDVCILVLALREAVLLHGTRWKSIAFAPVSLLKQLHEEVPRLWHTALYPVPSGPLPLPSFPWRVPLPGCAVYVSSFEQASDGEALARLGIGAVVNCTTEDECANCFENAPLPTLYDPATGLPDPPSAQITYLRLGLEDDVGQDLGQAVHTASGFIDEQRALGRPVLVHCAQGLSRSVSVVLGWLMTSRGMGYAQARTVMAAYRQHGARPTPNAGFRRYLMGLDSSAAEGAGASGMAVGSIAAASGSVSATAAAAAGLSRWDSASSTASGAAAGMDGDVLRPER